MFPAKSGWGRVDINLGGRIALLMQDRAWLISLTQLNVN